LGFELQPITITLLGSFGCKSTLNTENENSSFYLARGIEGSKIFGGVSILLIDQEADYTSVKLAFEY